MGRETINNQTLGFLTRSSELNGASSIFLETKEDTIKNYLAHSSRVWSDNPATRGLDKTMLDFIMSNHLLKDKFVDEGVHIVSELEKYKYSFKKDVQMLHDAVSRFKAPHAPNSWFRPSYRRCLDQFKKDFGPSKPIMAEMINTVDELKDVVSNPDASSGFFGCYTAFKHKRDCLTEDGLALLKRLEELALDRGTYDEPTLPGIRLQLSLPLNEDGSLKYLYSDDSGREESIIGLEYKSKTRMINMVSMTRIYSGLHFSKPFERWLNTQEWAGAGKDDITRTHMISSWRRSYTHWVGLDYSAYDQSLPGWFLMDMFRVIESWFCYRNNRERQLFWISAKDCVNKSIVCNVKGNVAHIHDGTESGVDWTYIINTVAHHFMQYYFAWCQGTEKEEWKDRKYYGRDYISSEYGDDGLNFSNGWFTAEKYLAFIGKVFGVIGHPAKCSVGLSSLDDPHYLSRDWTFRGPYRPWRELFIKLLYHERERDYSQPDVRPEVVFRAYLDCYYLGIVEGFEVSRFYAICPELRQQRAIAKETAKSIGGIVAYENLYGHKSISARN